jgi:hypothetical protein
MVSSPPFRSDTGGTLPFRVTEAPSVPVTLNLCILPELFRQALQSVTKIEQAQVQIGGRSD